MVEVSPIENGWVDGRRTGLGVRIEFGWELGLGLVFVIVTGS